MDQQAHSDLNGTSGEREWQPRLAWNIAPPLRQPMNPDARWVSLLATRDEIELHTGPEYIGWSAIDSNTYDAGDIAEDGSVYSTSPYGSGKTEAEAINDLFDQLEERA